MKIKFRAWDEQNKIMHSDFQFIKTGDEGNDWILFVSDKQPISDYDVWTKNPYFSQQLKIMQEIQVYKEKMYIGDIVNITIDGYLEIGGMTFDTEEPEKHRGVIIYSSDYYAYGIDFSDGCFMYLSTIECDEVSDIEVIGNIYENRELWKGVEK